MSDTIDILMLIPARGGSKRLAGKNLAEVGGLPLIGRTIACARRAVALLGASARIVVSTDASEIAACAQRFGAPVPFIRPAELATDQARSIDVIRHALDHFLSEGVSFREVVLLQPTSPLRTAEDIVSAVKMHRAHPQTPTVTVRRGEDGSASTRFRLQNDTLRDWQSDGDPVVLTGAVYVFQPDWARAHEGLSIAGQTRALVVPADRSGDIDTPEQLAAIQAQWEAQTPWPADRCYIIAEAGVNHDGQLDIAKQLVDAAHAAGADAVKFQTFDPERLTAACATKAAYQERTTDPTESQRDMLANLVLSHDDHRTLQRYCRKLGIEFLSSAFGFEDVDLLDELDLPMIKLGSGELTNHPLLTHAAATLRPIVCSTGAAYLNEVADAVAVLRAGGCDRLALLHCVSDYPANPSDLNLRAIRTLRETFNIPVGFSDHTMGIAASTAAVAMGACIIEKHLTLDCTRPGPDHRASLEPDKFKTMVQSIREVELALGDGVKTPRPSEESVRIVARRSLVAARELPVGHVITASDIAIKRPGSGIAPADFVTLIGKTVTRPIAADTLIAWDDLASDGGIA